MNKKAQTGIGTLIIFIAMLIVAAITANVFIQSATSLQNQALKTGKQTKESVSTFAQIVGVTATDGSNGNIEDFRIEMKLAPGSGSVDLSKALLTGGGNDGSINYIYSNNSCINDFATGYHTNSTYNNGTFTVNYLMRGDDSRDGYIIRGDIIELCFASGFSVGEDEEIHIKFTPQVGIPTMVETVTPDVMVTNLVRLFP
jgi:flagellin FlaB